MTQKKRGNKNMPKIIGYLKLFTYLCRYKYMVI